MTRGGSGDSVSVRWLIEEGVWNPHLPRAENMLRLAQYRAGLERIGGEQGLGWARDLVARYRAGRPVLRAAVKQAMEALGMPDEPILVRPAKPVPRPDAMERAAGDVEVEF
ncbi:hypothetical protein [Aromatoleum aromaticum]|uniref:hypothetical protein n=1 Tax=Aromatoleum aromaticum TaxID=551760 RepID=UPI0020424F25|nr:hypothetical protein [Aromatoleum aromaticum]